MKIGLSNIQALLNETLHLLWRMLFVFWRMLIHHNQPCGYIRVMKVYSEFS